MADYRDLAGVDRFVRALLGNVEARRRVLGVLGTDGHFTARAELLRANLRVMRGSVSLPRLTNADAVALVRAFDAIRARNPNIAAEFSAESLPELQAPWAGAVMIS